MDKIKCFDMEYSKKEKIQKLLRRIYFEQSLNKLNKRKTESINLTRSLKNKKNEKNCIIKNKLDGTSQKISKKNIIFKRNNQVSPKRNIMSTSNIKLSKNKTKINLTLKSPKSPTNNLRVSSFSEKRKSSVGMEKNKKLLSPISEPKSKTIYLSKTKNSFDQKYTNIKLNTVKSTNNIEKENKELNKYFNKEYIRKRNFIKKLEDRELNFQKNILKLKDTPKNAIELYNKQVSKQNANKLFQKIMSLFVTNSFNWKENLSPQEVKNVMFYDKLENNMIKSLDSKALIKFKNEEKKQKNKKYLTTIQYNTSLKNINDNNKEIINRINNKIEELQQREIIEKKIYKKLVIKNKRYLKNNIINNERRSPKTNNNITIPRKKFKSANSTPHSHLKKVSFH
jgi:hypothetical protein